MTIMMWFSVIFGAILACIIDFANAMSSGPRLSPGYLIISAPLPLVAIVTAAVRLRTAFVNGTVDAGAIGAATALLLALVSLAIALCTVFPIRSR